MNIPNILTIFRFVLIPFFCYFFFLESEYHLIYALIVFLIAGITDVLDGYIARRFNQITELGKMLDPLADKVMLVSVLICLATTQLIPLWILLLIILKELFMIIGGLYLYFHHVNIVIPSNWYGKVATVCFYLAIVLVLTKINTLISQIALYLAVFMAVVAFVNYFKIAKEMFLLHKE